MAFPAVIDQVAIDSRRIHSPHCLFIALKGTKQDGHHYIEEAIRAGARYIVVSSDWHGTVNSTAILLRTPSPVASLQSIAGAYRQQLPTQIIGITGSFGKTMVKDLLHAFLSSVHLTAASPESFNSQIGVPLSLLRLTKQEKWGLIEVAFSEKGELDTLSPIVRPDFTIVTPLGKKHLATLQNLTTLGSEVMKWINATSPHGWTLVPHEAPLFWGGDVSNCSRYYWDVSHPLLPHAFCSHPSSSTYTLSFPDGSSFEGNISKGHTYFLNLINMAIKGAWLLGVPSSILCRILASYRWEPMRTEMWRIPCGALILNDPYCADPQSIGRALRQIEQAPPSGKRIFVFGGIRTNPEHAPALYRHVGKMIAQTGIHQLLLVGMHPFHPLLSEIESKSVPFDILAFQTYPEAFQYLNAHLKRDDWVLFKGSEKLSLESLMHTFHGGMVANRCTINLAAIEGNLSLIRQRLPPQTRVMVIVKALAYGTDDVRIAKFLETCHVDILGVSYVDEGVALRQAGVTQSLFSIHATPYEGEKIVAWNLQAGVSDAETIQSLATCAAKQHQRAKVHLHINTGMGRFGCRPEEALALARMIVSSPSLELEGIMTHFSCAENPAEDAFTHQQIALFDATVDLLRCNQCEAKWIHAANSSAALRFYLPQYNMVRIGLAAYGLYSSDTVQQAADLRLALSLTSRIVAITTCQQGESVSYGRRYQITRPQQRIAVLPIGYFDGLHRNYSGASHVVIRGQPAPMVGTICMDYMMVDVTDIPHAAVGDPALVFGEDEFGCYLSPEDLAHRGSSIVHELITCLGPRIPRIFIHEEGKQIR